MKNLLFAFTAIALLAVMVMPAVLAVDIGTGIEIDIETEEFAPLIWQCNNRVVLDDCVEEGRKEQCAEGLIERIENYAFEGEQIGWQVLVMDKNKIEQIQEVVATIGSSQGVGNDIEVECKLSTQPTAGSTLPTSCNARILEEQLTEFDPDTMAFYDCLFTVETPDSMQDEYFLTAEVISTDGEATMDENEYWFLNPIIALSVDGDVLFENVRPGTVSYSSTILVGNDAEEGSGVLLDMFISGTDFYDLLDSGATCPDTNQLQLSNTLRSPSNIGTTGGAADADGPGGPASSGTGASGPHHATACQAGTLGITGSINSDHLCYYATNGAYSTAGALNADAEGYVPIVYGDKFTTDFYNDAEIVKEDAIGPFGTLNLGTFVGAPSNYHNGNVLSPGAEIALNFKLGLPEPCVGDFSSGDIFFWGEAI
jgi:hypothetical protein